MTEDRPGSPEAELGWELKQALARFGSTIAFVDATTRAVVSGADLLTGVAALEELLAPHLPQRAVVALVGDNSLEYLCAYVALQARGACTAEPLPEWGIPLLAAALEYLQPSLILAHREQLKRLRAARPDLQQLGSTGSWLLLKSLRSAALPPANGCALAFTGGTDGKLKAAILTPAGYRYVLEEINRYLAITAADVVGTALPWQHGYGKSVLLSALLAGARFCALPRSLYLKQTIAALKACAVTAYSGVPAQYRSLLSANLERLGWGARLACIAGGAMSNAELERLAAQAGPGCSVIPMYGLTEMTTRVSYLPPGRFRAKLGSCGLPLPGIRVRVAIEQAGEGELWVTGPNQMLGYWRLPEETAAALGPDGWLRTGDWGRLDEEGFIWISDRTKNVVKRGSAFVYPLQLEQLVRALPGVEGAATLGIPRVDADDELWLFIVSAGQAPEESELRARILRELGPAYLPQRIERVPSLPANSAGKTLWPALRELAASLRVKRPS